MIMQLTIKTSVGGFFVMLADFVKPEKAFKLTDLKYKLKQSTQGIR